MLTIIWVFSESPSFCSGKVLLRCWRLLTDQGGGCWRLGWLWQFLKIRQEWSLLPSIDSSLHKWFLCSRQGCWIAFLPRVELLSKLQSILLNSAAALATTITVVQLLSHVWLCVTPWAVARQASLSLTISQSLLKFMSIASWCHPAISSSDTLFSFCSQSFLASGSFPVSQLSTSGGQSIGASVSVLPMNIQGWFPLGLTGLISMLSKGLSRVFSSTFAVISTNFTTSLPVVYSISRNHFLYSLIKSNSSSTSFNNNVKVWNTVRIT